MRRARITFQGAFHHAMSRGHEGKPIYEEIKMKQHFLHLLKELSLFLRIRIFAYCLMTNHYHLVLENTSNRLSDFFKRLNGEFASYYRKQKGGRGYVFQDRYKSIIIQAESYLIVVIAFILNNPVRAGLTNDFLAYEWSSATDYFSRNNFGFIDNGFVEDLFVNKQMFVEFMGGMNLKKLPIVKTREGLIIGGEEFHLGALKKFDRRENYAESMESKRIVDNLYFDPPEKVIQEFEQREGIDIDKIDTRTYSGKNLRAKLLVYLRDLSGIKYVEISKYNLFSDVKFNSLGSMYTNAKKKMK